jgi:hypothetical protein
VHRSCRCAPHASRRPAQPRRRGRKHERARTIDQKVTNHPGCQDEAADGAKRLAAGVQGNDVAAAFEGGRKTPPLRAEHAGGMRLVDHHHGLVPIRHREQFNEVGTVTIHAVKVSTDSQGRPLPRALRQRTIVASNASTLLCGTATKSARPRRSPSWTLA